MTIPDILIDVLARNAGPLIEKREQIMPMGVIGAGNEIKLVVGLTEFSEYEEKVLAYAHLRVMSDALKCDWAAIVAEAWAATPVEGVKLPPSKRESRKEILVITVVSRDGARRMSIFPIERDAQNKRSLSFADPYNLDPAEPAYYEGPFFHLFDNA